MQELEHIEWFESPSWTSNIVLGAGALRYSFQANWNNRNNSWMISLKYDAEIIIQGMQLVLNVDLLANAHNVLKPECMLVAATNNIDIERISFDNMVNGNVKLYHILEGVA